ncbi:CoA pyrophosphatase [Thalassovita aquimarina]|nr:CoA pyrophosphatase [Thalassovita aquimarina]
MPDPLDPVMRALGRPSTSSSDFDLNPEFELPEGRKLRAAGVLVGFVERHDGIKLILTKRASHLKHHPGQIAFPGGKVDEGDADVTAAALREAHEEVGLHPDMAQVLGHLPSHETVTSFQVTPVLARVSPEFSPIPEPGEVDEVFEVPLHHIANPANFQIQARRWRGRKRHYFTVPFGPYYIWGATARILRGLADRMAE